MNNDEDPYDGQDYPDHGGYGGQDHVHNYECDEQAYCYDDQSMASDVTGMPHHPALPLDSTVVMESNSVPEQLNGEVFPEDSYPIDYQENGFDTDHLEETMASTNSGDFAEQSEESHIGLSPPGELPPEPYEPFPGGSVSPTFTDSSSPFMEHTPIHDIHQPDGQPYFQQVTRDGLPCILGVIGLCHSVFPVTATEDWIRHNEGHFHPRYPLSCECSISPQCLWDYLWHIAQHYQTADDNGGECFLMLSDGILRELLAREWITEDRRNFLDGHFRGLFTLQEQ